MEKVKELVKKAKEKNKYSEIIVRNDNEEGWFVHLFINPLNIEERDSLFKKYDKDLDSIINQLEMYILNADF